MLIRIVKMSFHQELVPEFLELFEQKKEAIKNSEGCMLLELYQDQTNEGVIFTYSHWIKKSDLENYRNSDLFKNVWAKTKTFFNDKPQAWSVTKLSV